MKTRNAVIVIALLSIVGHAQSRSMADATYALKGPVRTMRTEAATFVSKDGDWVEGERVVQMEASFNRDGNRTDFYIYNKGVLVRRIVMTFEGKRMIEAINYNGAGRMWLRMVYSYDDAGLIKEEKSYIGDGSLRSTKTFIRTSRGQISEIIETSAKGILMEQINNRWEGPNLYSSERKLYDVLGRLTSKEIYTAPANRRDTINYNSDGSSTIKTIHIDNQIAEFDKDGAMHKGIIVSAEGRLKDETSLNKDGSVTREVQLPDKKDDYGNWTKQTQWGEDANGTRPLKVTYRAITYYEN